MALNALPDADKIAHLLIEIIDQPERRKKLGQQAREFVEQHHHYREIASDISKLGAAKRALGIDLKDDVHHPNRDRCPGAQFNRCHPPECDCQAK